VVLIRKPMSKGNVFNVFVLECFFVSIRYWPFFAIYKYNMFDEFSCNSTLRNWPIEKGMGVTALLMK